MAFTGALRAALFARYETTPAADTLAMSGRAQRVIELILSSMNRISGEAQAVANSDTSSEVERQNAVERFRAAESVILHAIQQFYFGSGAFGELDPEDGPGLIGADSMTRFLADYSGVLEMLANSQNPKLLHDLSLIHISEPTRPY